MNQLLPYSNQYSDVIDPLEQALLNVEEVTDYLETADSVDYHRELLQVGTLQLDCFGSSSKTRTNNILFTLDAFYDTQQLYLLNLVVYK